MKRARFWIATAAIAAAAAAAGVQLADASAARPPAPHGGRPALVASPQAVRTGSSITVTGSGFRPGRSLVIEECAARFWIVPERVCAPDNAARVTADRRGDFRVSIRAQFCLRLPARATGGPERCYVGVPAGRGVDTVVLRYATPVTVTRR